MKKTVIFILIFIPCLSFANYENHTGKLSEYDALYAQINNKFKGECPSTITIKESVISGISQFNPKSSEILISNNNPKLINTIAHETVHLCMNRISNGASNTPKYRFIDEGYAKFYGENITIDEDTIRKITMSKAKKYANQNLVSFAQVMDWPKYFGNKGKGGVLGFESYYVGLSFYLYIKDTYSEEMFFKLVKELGTSLTFDRALKTTIGKTEEQIEEEWIKFIRTYRIKQ